MLHITATKIIIKIKKLKIELGTRIAKRFFNDGQYAEQIVFINCFKLHLTIDTKELCFSYFGKFRRIVFCTFLLTLITSFFTAH